MYKHTLQHMDISESKIVHCSAVLVGYDCNRLITVGVIPLNISIAPPPPL